MLISVIYRIYHVVRWNLCDYVLSKQKSKTQLIIDKLQLWIHDLPNSFSTSVTAIVLCLSTVCVCCPLSSLQVLPPLPLQTYNKQFTAPEITSNQGREF